MEALADFSAIEELCLKDDATARCNTWLPFWASDFKLKRITLPGCYVAKYHPVGMAEMESLETCTMVSPIEMEYSLTLRDVAIGSWTMERPQELVLAVCEIEDWVADRLEESYREGIELGQGIERARSGVFKMRKIRCWKVIDSWHILPSPKGSRLGSPTARLTGRFEIKTARYCGTFIARS
ncbi:hypothetical protein FRB94_014087 [Tulasnella sp. JGI-2019a]|nr:hypothetical protein FRB94_014087 [Tulasnella sp. JGI-2019a]